MATMTNHNCAQRQIEKLATLNEPFHFLDSGLPNVFLVGIRYFVCECGNVVAEIPAAQQLMVLLARDIVENNQSLTGDEIRFLRKRLGRKAADFARELGVEAETLSRLENGKCPVTESMDKLIRLVYAVSANDPELLRRISSLVNSWLADWSRRANDPKIVKKIEDNVWISAAAA